MLKALTKKEIIDQLQDSEKWIIKTQELQRVWIFDNFQEAMSFILRVAFLAEQNKHHPVIKNVYNRVELQLNTHDDDNQVTELDIVLANSINQIGLGSE
jgi:4a-hydroxytetrahydrobiopterin dehydratase